MKSHMLGIQQTWVKITPQPYISNIELILFTWEKQKFASVGQSENSGYSINVSSK